MIFEILQEALIIAVFVSVMMLTVEYLNVWTRGSFAKILQGSRWRQYLLAALLGASPGCLGAFVLVTLHVQRGITLGALAAGMIATSGDEIFVMLTLFPGKALALTAGLALLGVTAGWTTDTVLSRFSRVGQDECCEFVDNHESTCECFPEEGVLALWRRPRPERIIAALASMLFVFALSIGWIGPDEWDWEKVAFLVVGALGVVIVTTSSNDFFKEHLWTHVAKEHLPRLLLWTLGALTVVALVNQFLNAEELIEQYQRIVLVVAGLLGVIPESGPHLVFVNLYDQGALPLSVLVASSAVQDGHGMLPLLAHSRRDFFIVKGVNLFFGLLAGALLMSMSW